MKLILIVHDIRSIHNVGSLLRTAEGMGVDKVYFTGYTPYPRIKHDTRLPHIANKLTTQIHKTALGAEEMVDWEYKSDIISLIKDLKAEAYSVCALEQAQNSVMLPKFKPETDVALLLGREVEGIESSILSLCDKTIEIPMYGKKESFNVVQAAAMAMYQIRVVNSR